VQTEHTPKRSLVRVKLAILQLIFLTCWLGIMFLPSDWQMTVMGIGMIVGCLFFLIRCERCKKPLFSVWPDEQKNNEGAFSAKKNCPKCGLSRF